MDIINIKSKKPVKTLFIFSLSIISAFIFYLIIVYILFKTTVAKIPAKMYIIIFKESLSLLEIKKSPISKKINVPMSNSVI